MVVRLHASWEMRLRHEFEKPYFTALAEYVKSEYRTAPTYPPPACIFNALDMTPFDAVKVVILGQDPYHGKGQAHGLAFSVPEGVPVPPSLRNIFTEVKADVGGVDTSTNLSRWAQQGVLLLNATLTVREGEAGSHQGKGWEEFTDAVIRTLAENKDNLVFILWGNYARKKGSFIDRERHCVIESAHPSPLSANQGFFGSRPFSRANAYLTAHGVEPIVW